MKRFRITFSKTELIRYIGHLDVYHIWIRMFRRAKIQLVHSQGFHPQPKIQLASALSLGYTGTNEFLECWLKQDLTKDDLLQRILSIRHPGIDISSIEEIPLNLPAMQTRLDTQTYIIQLFGEDKAEMDVKLSQLFSLSGIQMERKKKVVNIRPFWLGYKWINPQRDSIHLLELVFSAREHANGKPDEILRLLGLDPLNCLIERTQLTLIPFNG